jgi:4-alpha-glucanotransferase
MITEIFQPSSDYQHALDRAASLWGIEPEYGDTWGRLHITSPETKKSILRAMGLDVETKEGLDRAVEQSLWNRWSALLPPVMVLGANSWTRGLPLHVPEELAARTAIVEICWEDGALDRFEVALATLETTSAAELRGRRFVCKLLPLPADSRLGYHEFIVELGGNSASMRLILCPDRAYVPPAIDGGRRAAGIAIALYGLRSRRNWGCGDFTDLEGIIDWAASETSASFIGLNPLHAIANRQPYNISPYLPSSTFFKNPIYLDLDRIEDFAGSARARRVFSSPEVRAEIEALRSSPFVEYERVWALKLRGLKLAFLSFLDDYRANTPRALDFRRFIDGEGEALERFATWCALDEWIHRRNPDIWIWTGWPPEFQDPESPAVHAFRKKHWRSVLFYMYAQWQVELQLAAAQQYAHRKGMPIGLYHDFALATDRFGADLWAHRPFFISGCRVGAPPDNFSPKGQDWAFPPPNSAHHRETGYRLFAHAIRQNAKHGGALRIDHVMRFFRLYWIPDAMEPGSGAYVRDRSEDLLHILALESVRGKIAIIGEDLGTVTGEIRHALDRFGLFGYKVLYFEKTRSGEFKRPWEYAGQALVAPSTHDLPTLAGFWAGRDIEARREAGLLRDEAGYREALAERAREKQKLLDTLFSLELLPESYPRRAESLPELTGELHNALVGWLASTPASLFVINQEDLFKDLDQQNLPATTSEYPNWRRKMRYSLEDLRAHAARDYTAMFRNWIERTGRAADGLTPP